MNGETFYQFRHDPGRATLCLAGDIGEGNFTSNKIKSDLSRCSDLLNIHIQLNSLGGDYGEAGKIYTTLRSYSTNGVSISVDILAVAASGGTRIALGGNTIRLAANGYIMIHDPWMEPGKDAADLRYRAALTENAKTRVRRLIHRRTGIPEAELAEMMKVETWFNSLEALHIGLIDEIGDPTDLAQSFVGQVPHEPGALAQRWGIWAGNRYRGREQVVRQNRLAQMRRAALAAHRKLYQW